MFWHSAPVANAPEGRTLIWRGIGTTEWVPLAPVEIAGGLTATMERRGVGVASDCIRCRGS